MNASAQPTLFDALEAAGDWAGQARRAIEAMAATGRRFQAHDLVEDFGLPEPSTSAAWGGAFRRAKADGIIRVAGYAPSRRPGTKGSALAEWIAA